MPNAESGPGAVDLSIIIVNWHSAQYVAQCLRSIFANPPSGNCEVVVVDNASFDESENLIRTEYPNVLFRRSEQNLGFAAANNIGAMASNGLYLLFLNPDTEVLPLALRHLQGALGGLNNCGILGAHLRNTDQSIQESAIQAFPTIANQLLDTAYFRRKFPRSRLWGTAPLYSAGEEPKPVDAISGACMLISRSLFEQIGGFSTEYFMYSEDIDLCFKAHRKGYQNFLVPNAVVLHHGGGSSGSERNPYYGVLMRMARWRYFRKFRGPLYSFLFRCSLGIFAGCRAALSGIAALAGTMSGNDTSNVAIYRKWYAISIWCLFGAEPRLSKSKTF